MKLKVKKWDRNRKDKRNKDEIELDKDKKVDEIA